MAIHKVIEVLSQSEKSGGLGDVVFGLSRELGAGDLARLWP